MKTKVCRTCGEEKPESEFYEIRASGHLCRDCKPCFNIIMRLNRKKKEGVDLEFMPYWQVPEVSYTPDFDARLRRADLMAVIDALPRRQALVLKLRFFAGETMKEIGERLGIGHARVGQIIEKAIRKLKHPRHAERIRVIYDINQGGKMIVKLTKIKELDDARHPNNIPVGQVKVGPMLNIPEVGVRVVVGSFITSTIQEILSENTFRTYNSVYQWEVMEP